MVSKFIKELVYKHSIYLISLFFLQLNFAYECIIYNYEFTFVIILFFVTEKCHSSYET
jgi:hypothetical protein